jgi:hypothetical protein
MALIFLFLPNTVLARCDNLVRRSAAKIGYATTSRLAAECKRLIHHGVDLLVSSEYGPRPLRQSCSSERSQDWLRHDLEDTHAVKFSSEDS